MNSPQLSQHKKAVLDLKTALDDISFWNTQIRICKSFKVNYDSEKTEYRAAVGKYTEAMKSLFLLAFDAVQINALVHRIRI